MSEVGPSGADRDLLDALRRAPQDIQRSVQAAAPEALRRPASDGGWGAVEHLAHLRDWEDIFLGRIAAVIDEDRPALAAYDDGLWSIERDYSSRSADRMLAEFTDLRVRTIAAVERVEPDAWEREGVHGVYGPVTLRWLLTRLHDHGVDHIRQIRDLLA